MVAAGIVLAVCLSGVALSPSMHKYGNVFVPSGLSAERALPATCVTCRSWPYLRVEVQGEQPPDRSRQWDPPDEPPIVSVDDVRRRLSRPPAQLLVSLPLSTTTFRTEVRQLYMPDFKEYFHGLFELNTIQRQSADWASRGSGINLIALAKGIQRAWRDYQVGKTRAEIEAELAQLRANNAAFQR